VLKWTRLIHHRPLDPPRSALQIYGLANLLACFRIIFYKDTFLALWMHSSFYTVDYSFAAAVPDIFQDIYRFNDLQLGLAYLPRGVGIITGSFCTGRLMDANYRATSRRAGWAVDRLAGDDLLAVSTATTVAYG
jgi:predicted MFS family arabinose efflux permease